MTLGQALIAKRKDMRLTQTQIARDLGISRQAYIAYEKDAAKPKDPIIYQKLEGLLNFEPGELAAFATKVAAPTAASIAAAATTVPAISFGLLPLLAGASIVSALGAFSQIDKAEVASGELRKTRNEFVHGATGDSDAMQKQKQFQAICKGLVLAQLAKKGISFSPTSVEADGAIAPDDVFAVKAEGAKEWWFYYVNCDSLEAVAPFDDNPIAARSLLFNFAFLEPNESRKVTLVIDNKDLYAGFQALPKNNSIRGNVSVVFMDSEAVEIKGETQVAFFGKPANEVVLPLL